MNLIFRTQIQSQTKTPEKKDDKLLQDKRLTVCVSGGGAGWDNAWKQEKPEARKMLENGDESPPSTARFVRRGWTWRLADWKKTPPPTDKILTHNLIFGNR